MLKNLLQNFLRAWRFPRWRWALVAAVLSDALGFGVVLVPPVQWLLDAVTAVVLFALLGFRWPLLPALAIEAVPALELFPAWTLVVAALASTEVQTSPLGARAVETVRIISGPGVTPENDKPRKRRERPLAHL